MQTVETQAIRTTELEPRRNQVLIVGRGAIGRMFEERMSGALAGVDAETVHEKHADVQVISHQEITPEFIATADVIILATPNHSVKTLIAEVLEKTEGDVPVILLLQNGVGVVEQAHEAQQKDQQHRELPLIRASVFTQVSKVGGSLVYNDQKLRIALANAGCTQPQLDMVKGRLEQAGFSVLTGETQKDGSEKPFGYKELEWVKLLANMIGATSTITGLSPKETFADKELFAIELDAFLDRLELLRVAKIDLPDIGWIKTSIFPIFTVVSKFGRHSSIVRSLFASIIAKQRNNQPSAAWSRVEANGDVEEAIHYFTAWTDKARSIEGGMQPVSKLDGAMTLLLRQQRTGRLEFGRLKPEVRKRILIEALNNPEGYAVPEWSGDYLPKAVERSDVDPTNDTQS